MTRTLRQMTSPVSDGQACDPARQRFYAVDEVADQVAGLVGVDRPHSGRELGEDGPELGPSQAGPQAVVGPAAAKGQVLVGLAADVEGPGRFEDALVPIGR